MGLKMTAGAVLMLVGLSGVAAQPVPGAQEPGHPSGSGMWDAEIMMRMYVQVLSRQYNLTPDQEQYTQKLLTKRVREFLGQHETDVRGLVWEMMEYQRAKRLPAPETAQQWANLGRPIFDDAREAILEGNKEWREILDDTQRARHDRDLRLLERQFAEMEERLDRWKDGDVQPTDFGPATGQRDRKISTDPWTHAKPEDTWEIYLRGFVARYRLDASQRETAESILKECRKRADIYREKRAAVFEGIEKEIAEARESQVKSSGEKEEIAKARQKLDELRKKKLALEDPIQSEIGAEFKKRLDDIPTQEQRVAYESRQRALRAAQERALAVRQGKKESVTTLPTTQPAEESAESAEAAKSPEPANALSGTP